MYLYLLVVDGHEHAVWPMQYCGYCMGQTACSWPLAIERYRYTTQGPCVSHIIIGTESIENVVVMIEVLVSKQMMGAHDWRELIAGWCRLAELEEG